jgi:DNA-binding transcriptional LysR family regulator
MDRFDAMDKFIRVVEAGTISGAAGRLGIAKSAVSRRLRELEEHLGVELFHRTTRKMTLTESGRMYYHQVVRILDDVREAELVTSQAHGQLRGTLRVALPMSFGLLHLGPAINEFIQTHPHIEFELDFNDRAVDLIQEGFDVAIRIARLPDSSLIARRLATMEAVLCASPAYLERHGTPERPEDLVRHQCLVYSLIPNYETWHFRDAARNQHTARIHSYIKATNGEYLRDAAVSGLGVLLVPSFIAYRDIERGALVPLLTGFRPPQLEIHALYPPTRHLSHRVRTFIDFLVQRFAGTPYWDVCLLDGND